MLTIARQKKKTPKDMESADGSIPSQGKCQLDRGNINNGSKMVKHLDYLVFFILKSSRRCPDFGVLAFQVSKAIT